MDVNRPTSDESPVEPPPKKRRVSRIGAKRRAPAAAGRDLFAGKIALAVVVLLSAAFLVWVLWEFWRL
jgi:hypothetical protein